LLTGVNGPSKREKESPAPETKINRSVVSNVAYEHYHNPFNYCKEGANLPWNNFKFCTYAGYLKGMKCKLQG